MQTDIPLKRLTALRAADLLPLIGASGATVVAVESLELPAAARRLDSALRLRSPAGQEYLHVIEWQGYHDAAALWRLVSYLAWVGQREPEVPVVGTIIYLVAAADIGESISRPVDGVPTFGWRIPCVRMWELEAERALATGRLGLAVLSPLMRGASDDVVRRAAAVVLDQAPRPQEADLLSILGVFAEPLMSTSKFVRMVGKEHLMASDLLSYLVEEKLAEIKQQRAAELAALEQQRAAELAALEQQRAAELAALEQQRAAELAALEQQRAAELAALEQQRAAERAAELAALEQQRAAELAALEQQRAAELREAAEDVIATRFPKTPAALLLNLRVVTGAEQLKAVRAAALAAPDQDAVEALLAALVAARA